MLSTVMGVMKMTQLVCGQSYFIETDKNFMICAVVMFEKIADCNQQRTNIIIIILNFHIQ